MKTPNYQEWNLSVQQALPSQTSFELSCAGSKGTHLQALADRNQDMTPGPGDVLSLILLSPTVPVRLEW
jgi:hypothetical protein